ncbi:putative photosynthetic complex assembly protein PuhE [Mongoliimonas terrestris]|uniref:putative photosynthetic complex assembly protein PuhE n=1 Tax=Mongoliimonas terrestris TaxID=1709001 RepID=UPI0009499E4A|nr:putative photosynthetic complex assembly protein PuhE [Mongoliimonas terrestris]
MNDAALAIGHALFLWWFGTGVVLYLDGLPPRTFRWTVLGATALLAAAVAALAATRDDVSLAATHVAFAAAVMVWAWNEVLFLTGLVTGPRRSRRPADDRGWRRFRHAAETILYHELLLAASAAGLALLLADSANRVGLWTFLTLWAMRLSTKLNIFLGVRNLGEAFLPDHLAYLASYFRRAPMNRLFPWSVIASSAALAALVAVAAAADTDPVDAVALSLVATLLTLAILEHGFLVLPLDTATLWRWGFRSRAAASLTPSGAAPVAVPVPLTQDPPPQTAVDTQRRSA